MQARSIQAAGKSAVVMAVVDAVKTKEEVEAEVKMENRAVEITNFRNHDGLHLWKDCPNNRNGSCYHGGRG